MDDDNEDEDDNDDADDDEKLDVEAVDLDEYDTLRSINEWLLPGTHDTKFNVWLVCRMVIDAVTEVPVVLFITLSWSFLPTLFIECDPFDDDAFICMICLSM